MIRKRAAGQALVESALALPFVLLLLTGGVQVGSIAYGAVSVDTAAREGARVGAESPFTSLTAVAASVGGTYTCKAPSSETNPICTAVYDSAGLLNTSNMTVTIKAPVSLSLLQPVPDDVMQVGNTSGCNGAQATVTGSVTYNGAAVPDSWTVQVSSNAGGTPVTVSGGQYSACFDHTTGQNTATISAQAMTSPDGCLYTASMSGVDLSSNANVTQNLALNQSSCPTTSTSTSTTTTTTTTSTGTTSTSTSTDTGTITQTESSTTAISCPSGQTVAYPAYFTVTVTYPVPIFVPFVDRLLGDSGNRGQRTMTTTVTAQVVPCGVSAGQ